MLMQTHRQCVLSAPSLLALGIALSGCGANQPGLAPHESEAKKSESEAAKPARVMLYGVANSAILNYFIRAPIAPASGAFTAFHSSPAPVLCSGGMVAVDAQFLYISAPLTQGCPGPGGQIYGYKLDHATGATTALDGSPFSIGGNASPQGMAAAHNNRFLYAADTNRIDGFSVDSETGALKKLSHSPFPSGDNSQLVVDPSGKFLYATDDKAPGGIRAFTIAADGDLAPIHGSPFGFTHEARTGGEPYGIVDTGKYLYTSLNATDLIAGFSIDAKTGALTPLADSPFPVAAQPASLALAHGFLYAVSLTEGSVSGFHINPETGALKPVPASPFTSDSATIAADPSGKYLYVSKLRGVQGYDVNPETGRLTVGAASIRGIDGGLWLTVVQLGEN